MGAGKTHGKSDVAEGSSVEALLGNRWRAGLSELRGVCTGPVTPATACRHHGIESAASGGWQKSGESE